MEVSFQKTPLQYRIQILESEFKCLLKQASQPKLEFYLFVTYGTAGTKPQPVGQIQSLKKAFHAVFCTAACYHASQSAECHTGQPLLLLITPAGSVPEFPGKIDCLE